MGPSRRHDGAGIARHVSLLRDAARRDLHCWFSAPAERRTGWSRRRHPASALPRLGSRWSRPYLEATGTTAAVNSADLVARVAGTLVSIGYRDGDTVKQGQVLFSIDPTEYRAKLQQAQAAQANSQAQLVSAEADLQRQATLGRENWSSQSTIDQARSLRDGLRATVAGQQAGITLAQLDLDYTSVVAPFEGVVSARLLCPGSLVGLGGPTKLTIRSLNSSRSTSPSPSANRTRCASGHRCRHEAVTLRTLDKVTVEAGLMTEEGYPHRGTLDYAAPQFDTGSGTITLRAMFGNADAALIPGGFARIRLPAGPPRTALVVPDEALGADQGGRYLLVLDKSNVVQQRRVRPGPKADSGMRVIDAGLDSADRVVVSRLQRAVPGTTVVPETVPITVARNGPGVTADAGAGGSGRR